MGPDIIIIKKGSLGSYILDKKHNIKMNVPAFLINNVIDTTGAGDSFAGGFIGYLEQTKDVSFENMKRAIIYGSAMASFCVEKFGTQKLEELTENDIKKRIQEFVDLVQFDIPLK